MNGDEKRETETRNERKMRNVENIEEDLVEDNLFDEINNGAGHQSWSSSLNDNRRFDRFDQVLRNFIELSFECYLLMIRDIDSNSLRGNFSFDTYRNLLQCLAREIQWQRGVQVSSSWSTEEKQCKDDLLKQSIPELNWVTMVLTEEWRLKWERSLFVDKVSKSI